MIELWKEEKECTGCGACCQACPAAAISMKENEKGFLFPEIDIQICVGCKTCIRVCPMKKELKEFDEKPEAFALRHRNKEVLLNSSSGGAFSAISQVFAKGEYVIFGAGIDNQLQVAHQSIKNIDSLDLLRKSKYVQSNIGDSFIQAKEYLDKGIKVFFVGTPCQIAGLKAFLGKEEINLLTCDLVCEGVQSQQFFNRYIQYMETKQGSAIKKVEFRSKGKHGWERSSFVIHFENGKKIDRLCHSKDNEYMNSSLFQGGNRASCYNCHFDRLPRQGDFTIGDLWGWKKITPEWNDNKGISLVLANTEKARAMLPELEKTAEIRKIEFESAIQKNPNVVKATEEPAVRKAYIADMEKMSFEQLASKWLKPRNWLRRLLSQVKYTVKKWI